MQIHVVADHCLVVHDHNRWVNVFGYYPKAWSKHAHIVNATVASTKSETGKVVILLINKVIEMRSLNSHLLSQIQCCMNGVLIDEVPKFLASIPSDTMHYIQIVNHFNAAHSIIIPLKLNGVTSYFDVKKPTWEDHEYQNILKIELVVKAPPYDQSRPEFSRQK